MQQIDKMKAVVESANECWHKGVHPLYKSVCTKCGKAFTQTIQKVNPSPDDIDELFRLAKKLDFYLTIEGNKTFRVFVYMRNKDRVVGTQEDTPAEALLEALYRAVQG